MYIIGLINYGPPQYRKSLRNMAEPARPMTSLLKQGFKFVFNPEIEVVVRKLLAELASPPVLVYPNRDAVTENSRPFLLYCDASVDAFGATLVQEQDDHTIRLIVFISRATIESKRHWTPLDLEAGSIVRSIKRLGGYLWATNSRFFSDYKALESLDKVAEQNPRVQ